MKHLLFTLLVLPMLMSLTACQKSAQSDYQSSSSSNSSSSSSSQTPTSTNQGLTNAKVETAVAAMLSDWRLGGSVSVRGIQEIPQQNAAIADLQFQQFEYGTTHEGGLVRAKDFKPKPMPNDRTRMPSMEEMFPQRKATYSKDGKAILARYNDGRWVLKEVRWGFDAGVKGTVEIR